jgi:methyl-accepting chemotaxis protein
MAAKEIGNVIKHVQAETRDVVKITTTGAQESAEAMDMADRASEALKKIISGIEKTDEIMAMIVTATSEQRAGSKEVLAYVDSMRVSSDQLKRAMTEQAAGGSQIRLAVEDMNRIMQEVTRATREQALGTKQIILAVENMNQMTQHVSVATSEQEIGGNLVVKSTENISSIVKENLAAVEQMTRSSEDLVADAKALLDNVARFKM